MYGVGGISGYFGVASPVFAPSLGYFGGTSVSRSVHALSVEGQRMECVSQPGAGSSSSAIRDRVWESEGDQ